ncbi:MAG TPA: hypothetical protein VFA04_27775 [Bryobacteraceae bacterium]|nr:hypothetical protein [Bryobacteraceae bacterium]
MPELLDIFVYNELESGVTAAEIAALLDMPQQQVWQHLEAARFSAELRQFRESAAPHKESRALPERHRLAPYVNQDRRGGGEHESGD